MHRSIYIGALLLSSCASHLTSWNEDRNRTDLALDEMRVELADLKHSLSSAKVDLQLLDEKLQGDSSLKSQLSSQLHAKGGELALLEKKIADLQRSQEKIAQDLRQLGAHANQTSTALTKMQQEIAQQNKRIEEVVKLKGTLSSLSQMLKERSGSETGRSYKVQPGDSLEKIAKQQGTTVEAIKRLNALDSDKIVVGKEIQLPE